MVNPRLTQWSMLKDSKQKPIWIPMVHLRSSKYGVLVGFPQCPPSAEKLDSAHRTKKWDQLSMDATDVLHTARSKTWLECFPTSFDDFECVKGLPNHVWSTMFPAGAWCAQPQLSLRRRFFRVSMWHPNVPSPQKIKWDLSENGGCYSKIAIYI